VFLKHYETSAEAILNIAQGSDIFHPLSYIYFRRVLSLNGSSSNKQTGQKFNIDVFLKENTPVWTHSVI